MDWERISTSVERLLMSQKGVTVPFAYQGAQYWGTRTSLRREDVNTDAGLADAYSFSLLCPASQFIGKELPKPRQDKVELDGVEYRVLSVEQDSAKATYRLNLGEALA